MGLVIFSVVCILAVMTAGRRFKRGDILRNDLHQCHQHEVPETPEDNDSQLDDPLDRQ